MREPDANEPATRVTAAGRLEYGKKKRTSRKDVHKKKNMSYVQSKHSRSRLDAATIAKISYLPRRPDVVRPRWADRGRRAALPAVAPQWEAWVLRGAGPTRVGC